MHQDGTARSRIMRALATLAALIGLCMTPLAAQVQTVDPNSVINSDLVPGAPASDAPAAAAPAPSPAPPPPPNDQMDADLSGSAANGGTLAAPAVAQNQPPANPNAYQKDDIIGAAEDVFGKGAQGLAELVEKILKDQGEPIAYIAGREASAAIGVGLRYGSGTMTHKVEGQRDVYWTGPSLGFDLGGNAGKTFVLVYNLYDSQDLYHRYPAGEGAAYFIGGFNASYLRWKKVVLIPIRLGVGYRLGANVGYMKFSEKRNWIPF